MLDGEVNDEEWDTYDNKNVADSEDTHTLVKLGGHYKMLKGVKNFKKGNITSLQLSTKEQFNFMYELKI